MRVGVALPHFGPAAGTDAVVTIARKAEDLGFASLWVLDRLLWPVKPASKYPGNQRGEMPGPMQNTWDPLVVLSFVAAHTKRVLLGTSVLVASYRSPVVTAKMAATLDLISGGRFILGLGAGWSSDEFIAVGQDIRRRDEQTDEFIEVVKELWTADEPSLQGKHYRVPRSVFLPKPAQRPHPPIWIGGNSLRALERVAAYGDGWHPTSRMPVLEMKDKMAKIRRRAATLGRDPERIVLTLRWNAIPNLTLPENRSLVAQKLRDYEDAGVNHICIDFNIPQPVSISSMIDCMERLREIVPLAGPGPGLVREKS